jgi:hypothetical protein
LDNKLLSIVINDFNNVIINGNDQYYSNLIALLFETVMNLELNINIELSNPLFKIVAPFLNSYISNQPLNDTILTLAHQFIQNICFFENELKDKQLVRDTFLKIPRIKNSLNNQVNVWFDTIGNSDNHVITAMSFTSHFLKQFLLVQIYIKNVKILISLNGRKIFLLKIYFIYLQIEQTY